MIVIGPIVHRKRVSPRKLASPKQLRTEGDGNNKLPALTQFMRQYRVASANRVGLAKIEPLKALIVDIEKYLKKRTRPDKITESFLEQRKKELSELEKEYGI